jgi:hypothetical protein
MIEILVVGLAIALFADDSPEREEGADEIATASTAAMSQWVMNYYQKPQPEQIPARVERMSQLGILRGNRPEANTMFLGQVMRANPDKIAGWMDGWKELSAEDRAVLHQAIWVSGTDEGKKWLTENGQKELAEKPGHPFVTNSPMVLEPYHVDLLWEWFFATGEKEPVERVVGMFNMLQEDPGEADLPSMPEPGIDRPTYLRKIIGRISVWSASSLAGRHDRLLAVLKEIDTDAKAPPRSRVWLKRTITLAERERAKSE